MANTPKNAKNFCCELCHFLCSKESDYNRHLDTLKHKRIYQNISCDAAEQKKYECKCGKKYNFWSGLWKHKKNCSFNENSSLEQLNIEENKIICNENVLKDNQINQLSELVKDLLKQNNELVQTIKEITPKIGNNTINNNCNNTNNNTFNLNMFLNEKCKDAINFSDFIETIQFTDADLENSRKNGGVSTLSNKMIKGLQQLDITKRPVHCTDMKRETLYIKEQEKWEKDENHEKIMEAFGNIAQKQREYLWEWSDANPDSQNVMHPLNDVFHHTNVKVLDPLTKKEEEGKKFIRNISKEITIDKNNN